MPLRLAVIFSPVLCFCFCSEEPTARDAAQNRSVSDAGTTDSAGDAAGTNTTGPDAASPDTAFSDGSTDGPVDDTSAPTGYCAPLPPPTGAVINVNKSQAGDLSQIVKEAAAGTTILLADGRYKLGGSWLGFQKDGLSLRSASGKRDAVILDGESKTNEIVVIKANDVTIADLTITSAVDHLIHASGSGSATIKNTRLHNLKLIDSGEQFVKVNSDGNNHFVDDGALECSHIELTNDGRPKIETNPGGCYTGGIDTHGGWGWKVRFNTFKGIYCDNGSLAEHAVHFWSSSRDTLVERNVIIDCARGVGFGLVQSGASRSYPDDPYPQVGYMGHIDGIIRNNVIHASAAMSQYYDTGIELAQAHGARVYHNTVVSKPTFSSIDYRFANTSAEIRNNLTFKITQRNNAAGTVDHNLQSAPASLFIDAATVDYHLVAGASAAIDQGTPLAEGGLDLDGFAHDVGTPDLGAYERR